MGICTQYKTDENISIDDFARSVVSFVKHLKVLKVYCACKFSGFMSDNLILRSNGETILILRNFKNFGQTFITFTSSLIEMKVSFIMFKLLFLFLLIFNYL